MPYTDLLVLCKSKLYKGYMIAGVDTKTGKWKRLVSKSEFYQFGLHPSDLILQDDSEVEIFDVIRVEIINAKSRFAHQPENYLVHPNYLPRKIGEYAPWGFLIVHELEFPEYIFYTPYSTLDRYDLKAYNVDHSLELVRVKKLCTYSNDRGFRVKADFVYNNGKFDEYYNNFPVTDIDYEFKEVENLDAFIIVSLGAMPSPYDGNYYKFIVKIFEIPSGSSLLTEPF